MRKISAGALALGLLWVQLGAAGLLDDAKLSLNGKSGKIEFRTEKGAKAVRLSGRTVRQQGTNYFVGVIELARPVDLTGKALAFELTPENPEAIIAVAVRAFNDGEKKPVRAHMKWGAVAYEEEPVPVRLWEKGGSPLPVQNELVSGKPADRVKRLEIWLGSTTADQEVALTLANFAVIPEETAKKQLAAEGPVQYRASTRILPGWQPQPQYASTPAKVTHPTGPYRQFDAQRLRDKVAQYEWARRMADRWRKDAEFWMAMDQDAIARRLPKEDAFFKCLCPKCGQESEFAWRQLEPDGESIRCTRCQTLFPNPDYPENRTYTIKMPDGSTKTVHYYHGQDQHSTTGENWGPRYHLTGVINYRKSANISTIRSLALLYALEGKIAYAEKVREVLLRYAAIYPGFSVKFRTTAYPDPRGHYMAGKRCGWKFHDSAVIPYLLAAYTLTVPSGVYSDADRLAIENGLCREYLWMIMAYPPTGDYCSNAVPAHMNAAAFCGAVLGEHAAIDWVLKGDSGLISFVRQFYRRDGFWHEASASYANMANVSLAQLILTLQGYSDPADYTQKDRYDVLDVLSLAPELAGILKCMAPGTLPTGCLPAVNDSAANAAQSVSQLVILAALRPTPENRNMAEYFANHNPQPESGVEMLFLQDPTAAASNPPRPDCLKHGVIVSGGGWALLRRPATAEQAAALISFPPFSSHAHHTMLNLVLCEDGREVVNDLGYLSCWHENYRWIYSPLAHNTVMVDDRGQSSRRYGEVEFFAGRGDGIQAMRVAGQRVFDCPVSRYARTIVDLPLPEGRRYLVDLFEVKGGKQSHSWIFHADGVPADHGADWQPAGEVPKIPGWEFLKNVKSFSGGSQPMEFLWRQPGERATRVLALPAADSTWFRGIAPGERNQFNPAKINLHVLLERKAGGESKFLHLIENGPEKSMTVKHASRRDTPDGVQLTVDRTAGSDRIEFRNDGRILVRRFDQAGQLTEKWATGDEFSGRVTAVDAKAKIVTTDWKALPGNVDFAGCVLQIRGVPDGAYMLDGATLRDGQLVFRLARGEICRIKPGDRWYSRPLERE